MINYLKSSTNNNFFLLAGPCVIEGEQMALEIAEKIVTITNDLNIPYVFKGSYRKANRSRIDSFTGIGDEKALKILRKVKESFNIPVVTDIHTNEEAEMAAEYVDILQIPAFLCRQTELLIAAAKTGKMVNIKKGQFMAPEDMRGAVEKFRSTGNNQVMLTERGSSFGYHNLVVDFRSLPTMRSFDVPVIFDATHSVQLPGGLGNASGGQREFIFPLARAAAAAGIDAIFCEVHPNPAQALSDGPNSLDFAAAEEILTKVKAIHDLC